jgi:hypothetical protein
VLYITVRHDTPISFEHLQKVKKGEASIGASIAADIEREGAISFDTTRGVTT